MGWLAAAGFALAIAGCSDSPRSSPIDAAIDAAIDALDPCKCRSDQLCVLRYDGTCRGALECVAKTVDCPGNACTPACAAAYCPSPYQCQNRPPCGTEPPQAFTCYGP